MIHRVILALLLFVAGMLAVAMWRVEVNRTPNLAEILEALRDDKVNLGITNTWVDDMQTITTQVTGQSGQVHTVTTERKPDESVESWKNRHQEAIEMARLL